MSWLSSLIGGVTGSTGAKKAALGAEKKNDAAIALATANNNALLAPYQGIGVPAGQNLNALLGIGDPTAANAAYEAYKGSANYQQPLQEGLNGVTQNHAVNGLLNSGSALKALTKYGADYSNNFLNNYESKLAGQESVGVGAANSGIASNNYLLGAQTGNTNTAADAVANASLVNGQFGTNLLKQFAGIGGQQNASSYSNGGSSGGGDQNALLKAFASAFGG